MLLQKTTNIFGQFLQSYARNRDGSVLPIAIFTLPIILSLAALGIDAAAWMAQKRTMQISADAAAIAAGWEYAQGQSELMEASATREAANNGYDPSANGALRLQTNSDVEGGTLVSVTIAQDAPMYLTPLVYSGAIRISASAEAMVSGGGGSELCILALEEDDRSAVGTFGTVEIEAPECDVAINSEHDNAMQLTGNVDLELGDVSIVGGFDVNGNSADYEFASLSEGAAAAADPYEDMDVPEYDDCDYNDLRVNSDDTLSPGVYCGGLDISGNNDITMEPGLYIMNGGTMKVTGGGTLEAEEVTIIFTGSGNDYAGMDISGSREVTLSAPEEGDDWAGIALFQDRNAPDRSNLENKIVGTSDIRFDGVAYFPSQGLWFGGNTNTLGSDAPCTKLIARTVTFAGNPRLGTSCDAFGLETTGNPEVRLIQ